MIRSAVFLCLCLSLKKGVFGETDEVKSVSVTEGDSVTLNTDVQVQRDDQILWTFNDTRIAEIHRQIISYNDKIEKFKDRLHMDNETGSLTIRNIRKGHAGLYKQEIIRSSGSNMKNFYIYIYDHLPFSVITSNCSSPSGSSECRCSLVCSVLNEENYEDNNTYSCVIYNPTTHLNITQLCQLCKAQDQRSRFMMVIAVILALLAVTAIAVVGGLIYHRRCKKTWKIVKPHDEEMHYTDSTVCADLLQSTDAATADCGRVWGSCSCRLMLPDMSCRLR